MTPYVVFELIIIIFAFALRQFGNQKHVQMQSAHKNGVVKITNRDAFIAVASILLILFMGLRGSFATDYKNYAASFQSIAQAEWVDILKGNSYKYASLELGFRILNKVISLLCQNTVFYMVCIATIFICCTVHEGNRTTDNVLFFVLFFVNAGTYFLSFNMMRQALAASITYCGTIFLQRKQWVKYLLVVLLATSIHTTAIVMFAACWLLIRPVNKKNMMMYIVIAMVAWVFLPQIISFVQQYKYGGYTYGMNAAENLNGVIVQWAVFLFACWQCYLKKVDLVTMDGRIIFNGAMMFVITSLLSRQVMQISRLSYFFSPYLMALGANAVNTAFQGKTRVFFKLFIIIMLVLYMYVWFYGDSAMENYRFFWQE